jgi:glutaminyl-tRNA synthetase
LRLFADRIGVTKSDSWIDYSTLEGCLREDLELKAHRAMAVLDPIKLVLTNWDEAFGAGHLEPCTLPALPHPPEGQPEPAARQFTIGKEVWIERDDFAEQPPKGYKRLSPPSTQADGSVTPGSIVRLKAGYIVQCTGCLKDSNGVVTEVHATVFTDTKSGTAGADSVKAKGVITWVGVSDGVRAQVRLYDRLFNEEQPDAGGRDFLTAINPDSLKIQEAWVEPSLLLAKPDDKFQFERLGYFVADRVDHHTSHLVFNRAVSLKDNWSK